MVGAGSADIGGEQEQPVEQVCRPGNILAFAAREQGGREPRPAARGSRSPDRGR
jgi:hypothetical protein